MLSTCFLPSVRVPAPEAEVWAAQQGPLARAAQEPLHPRGRRAHAQPRLDRAHAQTRGKGTQRVPGGLDRRPREALRGASTRAVGRGGGGSQTAVHSRASSNIRRQRGDTRRCKAACWHWAAWGMSLVSHHLFCKGVVEPALELSHSNVMSVITSSLLHQTSSFPRLIFCECRMAHASHQN